MATVKNGIKTKSSTGIGIIRKTDATAEKIASVTSKSPAATTATGATSTGATSADATSAGAIATGATSTGAKSTGATSAANRTGNRNSKY